MRQPRSREPKALLVSCATVHGGAERSLLAMAARLPDHGVHAVLACPSGDLLQAARAAGVPVVETALVSPGSVRGAGRRVTPVGATRYATRNARNVIALVRVVRSERPDVLHSNSLPSHLATTVAGRLTGRPVGWHLREIVRTGPGRRMLDRYGRWAVQLVAISDAVAASVDHPHVEVVLNPVSRPEHVEPVPPVHAPRPLVGFLGRVEHHKGVEELVEAMGGNTAHLVVMGPTADPAYDAALAEAADRHAPGRVHLVGRVANPWSALVALDVLVVPSHAEPFGRVAAEGQLAGVAVLAADSGGLPEIVTDGVDGLLFRTGDRDDLATQLRRLLDDDALRARLGAAGTRNAARFDPDRHATRMAEVLRRLAVDHDPARSPDAGQVAG